MGGGIDEGGYSVSKITLTRQWAGGGTGSDAADGGVAAAEATYFHQRMQRHPSIPVVSVLIHDLCGCKATISPMLV
jgi:hypothetical protein